ELRLENSEARGAGGDHVSGWTARPGPYPGAQAVEDLAIVGPKSVNSPVARHPKGRCLGAVVDALARRTDQGEAFRQRPCAADNGAGQRNGGLGPAIGDLLDPQ